MCVGSYGPYSRVARWYTYISYNSLILAFLEGHGMENLEKFYDHLV
jgi:hypothetical protein